MLPLILSAWRTNVATPILHRRETYPDTHVPLLTTLRKFGEFLFPSPACVMLLWAYRRKCLQTGQSATDSFSHVDNCTEKLGISTHRYDQKIFPFHLRLHCRKLIVETPPAATLSSPRCNSWAHLRTCVVYRCVMPTQQIKAGKVLQSGLLDMLK